MAIKMGVLIYFGIWLGQQADENAASETPWFTVAGSLLGVGLALYFAIRDLQKL